MHKCSNVGNFNKLFLLRFISYIYIKPQYPSNYLNLVFIFIFFLKNIPINTESNERKIHPESWRPTTVLRLCWCKCWGCFTNWSLSNETVSQRFKDSDNLPLITLKTAVKNSSPERMGISRKWHLSLSSEQLLYISVFFSFCQLLMHSFS